MAGLMLCAACRHPVEADETQCSECHRVLTLSGAVVPAPEEPAPAIGSGAPASAPSGSGAGAQRPPCAAPGCGLPVARGRTLCSAHQAERTAERNRGFALLGEGWQIDVAAGQAVLLGRDPHQSPVADRFTGQTFVSGRHATVTARQGLLFVVDHGSDNGTKVNGTRLAAGAEQALVSGDQLCLGGQVTLVVR